ncbi:unnamed protein product [Thelazia callipaeda]|uniref:ENTH domain-containing protein n=1 Tax=Thelazia callipaeda TaxID=103827 RepID=A0A0N5D1M3_THECL|nr:unnamed protein product [Thelazia callipaeda]
MVLTANVYISLWFMMAKNELKRPFSDSTENLTITTNTYEHLLTKAKYNKQSVENVKRNLMGEFGSNKDANQSEQNLAALKFNLITTDTPFTESNAVVSEKMATTASNFDIEPNDLVTHNDPSWESANLPDVI